MVYHHAWQYSKIKTTHRCHPMSVAMKVSLRDGRLSSPNRRVCTTAVCWGLLLQYYLVHIHPFVLRMQRQQQQPPPAVVAPIPAQQWAQCENPNCNKWRLLPVGAVLNENEPWYCYMNPDPDKNTCEAPEAVRLLRFQSRSMY